MIEFDEQAARTAEAMYVTPDIVEQRQEVRRSSSGRAGVESIPYDDGSFDAVVCTQVLEYVTDIPQADAEAWTADLLSMGEAYFFSLNR